jgi:hypothetical protein
MNEVMSLHKPQLGWEFCAAVSSVTLFVHIWPLSLAQKNSWWADSGWWIHLSLDDFVNIEIHMLMPL